MTYTSLCGVHAICVCCSLWVYMSVMILEKSLLNTIGVARGRVIKIESMIMHTLMIDVGTALQGM